LVHGPKFFGFGFRKGISATIWRENDGAEMTREGKMGAGYENITIINHHGDRLADDNNNNKPTS
jgi:hypothetical protein